jgi:hypothetical protein
MRHCQFSQAANKDLTINQSLGKEQIPVAVQSPMTVDLPTIRRDLN